MSKYTTDIFIEKAKKVHGDKYDYSKVDYVTAKDPVIIICPEHGEFLQKPMNHLRGNGCIKCGYKSMSEKIDYKARDAKSRESYMKRYGVDNPMKVDSVKAKVKQTCLERYGFDNPRHFVDYEEKTKAKNRELFGTDWCMQSDEGKRRSRETNLNRYGADNFMKSEAAASVKDIMREKSIQTSLERYGVEHYSKSEDFKSKLGERKAKELHTKVENNSFNTSDAEEKLYELLCNTFGEDDVVRQFTSDEYPFAVDFYIKSRDLYIELNAFASHNNHWFGSDPNDVDVLNSWLFKNTKYYYNLADCWSVRDVEKRSAAKNNNLNYVIFWDDDLTDAELWFALGCPDGKDWDVEYSWIPDRELINDVSERTFSSKVKGVHFNVFYKKELELWNENKFFRGKRLRDFLFLNRFKYLGKLPNELTCYELLRGMTISGIHKGYTCFDTAMMKDVITELDIQSVYDPCAGWGERLLLCSNLGVDYYGVDINPGLISGYSNLLVNAGSVSFVSGDSSDIVLDRQFDALITCPPYGDIEIYSDRGAENLDSKGFADWWQKVLDCCKDNIVKYICIQTNQKYKELFSEAVRKLGFEFKFEKSSKKVNHFNRAVSGKTEYESMVVFEK